MTDPIADMITRIRNAVLATRKEVRIPHSTMKMAIAILLLANKYVTAVTLTDEKPQPTIVITLKYVGKLSAISGLNTISSPGRRLFARMGKLPRVLNGYGISILSTNKGLMIDREAKKSNVGGEIVCQVW